MHWFDVKPQIIIIKSVKTTLTKTNCKQDTSCCPYYLLQAYAKQRPSCVDLNEPFFVLGDRSLVKPQHMRQVLKLNLKLAGFQEKLYDTHSLRIGAALDLLAQGIPVETIKKLGRWKSNVVYSYFRC